MHSNICGEKDLLTVAHSLNPIVHKISHDEQMDNLADHKPNAHIFRQDRRRFLRVELIKFRICENPKDDR